MTMRTQAFAAVTRRTSLLTLGGAGLAASLAMPQLGDAKKKKGKDCKKKEKQRCSSDAAACKQTVAIACQDPAGCFEESLCCEECSASGFLTCLIAASQP